MVDTCAGEFVAYTPYLYSTYEEEDEAPPTERPKVVLRPLPEQESKIGVAWEVSDANLDLSTLQL